jgi:hypothetical protein
MKGLMNSKYSSLILIGIGQLMFGISTIFFQVSLGFFDTLVSRNNTAYTGLSQVIPITPLIVWVVVFLLGIMATSVGGFQQIKKSAAGNAMDSWILIGVSILMFGISTIFFTVTLGFFDTLLATETLSTYTGLPQIIPITPLIMWVVTMLLSVVGAASGGMQLYKKSKGEAAAE